MLEPVGTSGCPHRLPGVLKAVFFLEKRPLDFLDALDDYQAYSRLFFLEKMSLGISGGPDRLMVVRKAVALLESVPGNCRLIRTDSPAAFLFW